MTNYFLYLFIVPLLGAYACTYFMNNHFLTLYLAGQLGAWFYIVKHKRIVDNN